MLINSWKRSRIGKPLIGFEDGAKESTWSCLEPPGDMVVGKDRGRIIFNLVENGPLIWPTVEQENGTVRPKTYEELSDKEKLQAECDLKATNIFLQGLPLDQERDCKLYDKFDKFSHVKGETLYKYYLRFTQLINEINIIQMTMQPVQVNTKFLNSLSLEWGKFMTDVKLARDFHTSNYDQLYACLEQHDAHANEARLMRERFPQVQRRQGHNVVGAQSQGNASGSRGNTSGQEKIVKCYNCQGEGHMARQYGQVAQTIIHNAAFQTDDLDAYDSDCDDISSAKAVLLVNLSSCDSDFLSEVSYSDTFQNDMMNQSVQELQYSEQSPIFDYPDNKITSDSNIIPYS
ncbi:integrase, catalytic region, zinc finger, CCHC-type containing protein [Tanacetum coccineum]